MTMAGMLKEPGVTLNTLGAMDVAGKRVVLRLDLNVPMRDGQVTDATRIVRSLKTVRALLDLGATVVILSHLGRPQGRVQPEFSLRPVGEILAQHLSHPVVFVETNWEDGRAREAVLALRPGQVALLENTRFHPGEEANDPGLCEKMAELGEIYINDAFSVSHRAHASTEGIAHLLPAAAGLLMEEELSALSAALTAPTRPLLAIVGGAKVSTKIALLSNLVAKVDILVISGAMANTFLKAQGQEIGSSLVELELVETARGILARAEEVGCSVVLPCDGVVAEGLRPGVETQTVDLSDMPPSLSIFDAGPRSVERIVDLLGTVRTVLWNGPLGAFEVAPFDGATVALARVVAEKTEAGQLVCVAGGGDTVAALEKAGVCDRLSYVSTAGGAFLEWLEGRELPGVEVLYARD